MAKKLSKDTSILVTGGAGLIGSAIVHRLNELGYQNIVIVDHLGKGEKWQNLRGLHYVDYYEKDVFYDILCDDFDQEPFKVIFHLGACSDTTEVDASYLADNNFATAKLLAQYAKYHGSRMIYASSAATYGDGECGFADDEKKIYDLRPLNKYGFSKLIFDQYLDAQGWLTENNGLFVGVKYSNVFGPNEYHKAHMRSMVLRAYEQISTTGKVALFRSYKKEYADGEQVRDFLYVKDAADMTIFFMNEGQNCSGLYNIGYGETRSWNDLAKAMFTALKKPVNIEYIEMPETLRPRYQYYTCLEMDKLRKAGYKKKLYTLEAAVADYAKYLPNGLHLTDI